MKTYITIFAIIISIISINCGGDNNRSAVNGEVEIVFWHSFVSSTVPALNDLIARFEKENPGIKIKAQYIPTGDALIQKLITAIQSKTAPDISWLHSDFMENLVDADAIYKMDDFIKGADGISQEDLNDIYPALRTYASYRGTLYSIPMEATNLALLYNKDMFKQAGLDPEHPPKDWNELRDFTKKLTLDKNNDGIFDQVGFFIPINPAAGPLGAWTVWQFMPYLWQAGGNMIDSAQTHVLYNEEPGIESLNLWKELYIEQKLNTFTTDFDVAFASKRLAMAMDGPWNLPRYKDLLKNLNWAFAPLPSGPVKQATVVGGEYLAIFKQSKHPKEAWKFIKWMVRPEIQSFWAIKSGYLPVRRAVLKVPEFQEYLKKNSNFKVFVDQMEVAEAQKPIDYGALEITHNIAEAIERATIGKMDVRTVLNEAANKSNKLLKPAK